MNRRAFSQVLGGLVAAAVLPWKRPAMAEPPPPASPDHVHMAVPTGPPQQIAMLITRGAFPWMCLVPMPCLLASERAGAPRVENP